MVISHEAVLPTPQSSSRLRGVFSLWLEHVLKAAGWLQTAIEWGRKTCTESVWWAYTPATAGYKHTQNSCHMFPGCNTKTHICVLLRYFSFLFPRFSHLGSTPKHKLKSASLSHIVCHPFRQSTSCSHTLTKHCLHLIEGKLSLFHCATKMQGKGERWRCRQTKSKPRHKQIARQAFCLGLVIQNTNKATELTPREGRCDVGQSQAMGGEGWFTLEIWVVVRSSSLKFAVHDWLFNSDQHTDKNGTFLAFYT